MRRLSAVALLVLGFRRAKTNRDRELGRVFDRPRGEDYRDGCPKSDLPLGTPPPMSAPKNKEASGPTIFFEQADPVPPAERVVAFAFTTMDFARGRQLRSIDSPGPRLGTRVR